MNIYQFDVKKTNGEIVSLQQYAGKVILIFNSATKCGYTPQYEAIEQLYKKYHHRGLEILDFPCNQFLSQAPGSDAELANFCQMKFNTTFETFARVNVNGKNASPLFKYMRAVKPDDFNKKRGLLSLFKEKGAISWNFTKFLINREGEVVERFGPGFVPQNIETHLEKLL